MGEDEPGEGVIEKTHQQDEQIDKCVCVCTFAKAVRKKKEKSIISLLFATFSGTGPQ